jgi:hypothetical protein
MSFITNETFIRSLTLESNKTLVFSASSYEPSLFLSKIFDLLQYKVLEFLSNITSDSWNRCEVVSW